MQVRDADKLCRVNLSVMSLAAATQDAQVTWVQVWTLIFAGIAAVGGVGAAIISAVTSSWRDRDAFLRQLQIEGNRDFHASTLALAAHLVHRSVNEAIRGLPGANIDNAVNAIHPLQIDLMEKHQKLVTVARSRTLEMANDVCALFRPWRFKLFRYQVPRTRCDGAERRGPQGHCGVDY